MKLRELNTCMKNNDQQTSKWLRDNGINEKTFADVDIDLLQAQKMATNVLKHNRKLLGPNEAATLNSFLQAMRSKQSRAKLKLNHCYKVMNICNAVNRKLFKQYKEIKKR